MLSKIKQDAESAMKKALEHTIKEFSTIHTGKPLRRWSNPFKSKPTAA